MFYYLDGTVTHVAPHLAVVDCGGVGYACNTTANTLASLQVGQRGKLYTYLHVREEIFDLYGFTTEEELRCFKMLLGISGVGPKAALSILSAATPSQLALSILAGDEKVLTVAPGIGKKLAQRIILETRDLMVKRQKELGPQERIVIPAGASQEQNKAGEVAAALQVLGYSQSEAMQALKGLDLQEETVENLVRQALKRMMA